MVATRSGGTSATVPSTREQPLVQRAINRALEKRSLAATEDVERIIEATYRVVAESGTVDPGMREILREAGLSTQAFYRHFASKDELLLAMVTPLINALRAVVDDVRVAGTVRAELVRELVDVLDANAPLVRSLTSDPAITRAKLEGRGAAAPFAELERSMSGSGGGDAFRGRCVLGLIVASVIGPPRREGHQDGCAGSRRLTESEKEFVTAAAMAVLAVPVS